MLLFAPLYDAERVGIFLESKSMVTLKKLELKNPQEKTRTYPCPLVSGLVPPMINKMMDVDRAELKTNSNYFFVPI